MFFKKISTWRIFFFVSLLTSLNILLNGVAFLRSRGFVVEVFRWLSFLAFHRKLHEKWWFKVFHENRSLEDVRLQRFTMQWKIQHFFFFSFFCVFVFFFILQASCLCEGLKLISMALLRFLASIKRVEMQVWAISRKIKICELSDISGCFFFHGCWFVSSSAWKGTKRLQTQTSWL